MVETKNKQNYDVIIIGGGITGAGTARDCALRGLKTLLIERFDLTHGATGRNHGLLHSGARYAVTDGESANECIRENMILRRIASHCVEECEGLFITLPEDDLTYQKTFIDKCRQAGIEAEAIDPKLALSIEPSVNPSLIGAVKVPDGSIDPFRLTSANMLDAKLHGAEVLTYHKVTDIIKSGDTVVGVKMVDLTTKQTKTAYASITINAAGIWGQEIVKMAGSSINMFPAKGSLLVFGHRVNNVVINRCRKPANADILVPGDTVCVIGTTSSRVPFDECDDMRVTPEEVDVLLQEGAKLAPSLLSTRILRAYAGVRPLVANDGDPSGRSISRGIVCIDHDFRDGISGFITITGGKLMTYRLMAEWATDLACIKLNNSAVCYTATQSLPGSVLKKPYQKKTYSIGEKVAFRAASARHGNLNELVPHSSDNDNITVCECEHVTRGEINYAIDQLCVKNLLNLRRRTRVAMGTCQGTLCACRAAGLLERANGCASKAQADLARFLNERWKGIYPVAWGEALREAQLTSLIYEGVCGLDEFVTK